MPSIPVVPFVAVSAVVEHPIEMVWDAVQMHNFHKWYRPVARSYKLPNEDASVEIVRWEFNAIFEENSCDFEIMARDKINYTLSYYVHDSLKPLKYAASASSIKLFPITFGEHKGHTFMQYTGEFASDATSAMIENSVFVRNDAISCLRSYLQGFGDSET
ncbi:hypothetical protein QQZ08_010645 [Neonectria magnoliae]|uniref:Uncharacterized protein n=1 Tax=Neonectria magnoliae TaxID=2732573 RepID=A0ABR1HGH8_9HYPO